jgi:hypothetical protein
MNVNWQEVATIGTAVVTCASAIAAATKNPKVEEYSSIAGQIWVVARRIIGVLGLAVGHAAPATAEEKAATPRAWHGGVKPTVNNGSSKASAGVPK